jgi:transcription initiation factor TFIIIB Brf1 subunit/transcription initiation factor TFIIB
MEEAINPNTGLKSCPLCHSEAILIEHGLGDHHYYIIECPKCGCALKEKIKEGGFFADNLLDAINKISQKWNANRNTLREIPHQMKVVINTWHIINGKYVKIDQIDDLTEKRRYYYTDGKSEAKQPFDQLYGKITNFKEN